VTLSAKDNHPVNHELFSLPDDIRPVPTDYVPERDARSRPVLNSAEELHEFVAEAAPLYRPITRPENATAQLYRDATLCPYNLLNIAKTSESPPDEYRVSNAELADRVEQAAVEVLYVQFHNVQRQYHEQ